MMMRFQAISIVLDCSSATAQLVVDVVAVGLVTSKSDRVQLLELSRLARRRGSFIIGTSFHVRNDQWHDT